MNLSTPREEAAYCISEWLMVVVLAVCNLPAKACGIECNLISHSQCKNAAKFFGLRGGCTLHLWMRLASPDRRHHL